MSVRAKLRGFLRSRLGLLSLGFVVILAIALLSDGEPQGGQYLVESVIDGDTIAVDRLRPHVRYLGIDTPEISTPDSPGEPLAEEAKEFNERLVLGKTVKLEFDAEKYDRYGRLLAYVFVGDEFVNEALVREGLARSLYIGPNYKYESRIIAAENSAKRAGKGIWSSLENLVPPSSNYRFLLEPPRAGRFVGKRAVVRGKITGHRRSRSIVALTMGEDFDVVIFTHDLGNFSFFGIDPVQFYEGRTVEVTGRITAYKGKPQIVVEHPMALRVVD